MLDEACCTCATLLSAVDPLYDEETEKPRAQDHRLECCGRIVCGNCVAVSHQMLERFVGSPRRKVTKGSYLWQVDYVRILAKQLVNRRTHVSPPIAPSVKSPLRPRRSPKACAILRRTRPPLRPSPPTCL